MSRLGEIHKCFGAGGETPELCLSRELARALALELGFTEVGVVALPHAADGRDAARFEQWIGAGNAGTMRYLERRGEDGQLLRSRVAAPFPWARSAIVCYALYHCPQPLSIAPSGAGSGWIARYAWTSRRDAEGRRRPSDYHKVLKKRLTALEAQMHSQFGDFEARGFVDTGPLVERSLATAAGLGWTGKNTCLIHPKLGSYGFLAVLLTSLPVQRRSVPSHGTRPLRHMPPLHRGMPHQRAYSVSNGCDQVHLLPDHRAQGANRRGPDAGNGPAGLRLRYLSGRLPLES